MPPSIRASLERAYRRDSRFGSIILQILSQERRENLLAELQAGVGVKANRAERAAIADFLAVMPWAHHQENLIVVRIPRLDGFVNGYGAVDVFLVPEAVHQHYGHFEGLIGQNAVNGL